MIDGLPVLCTTTLTNCVFTFVLCPSTVTMSWDKGLCAKLRTFLNLNMCTPLPFDLGIETWHFDIQ